MIQGGDEVDAISELTSGAYVDDVKWIAQSLVLPNAASVTGVLLLFHPLTPKCELTVELHEDWQGQPSGKVLASGTVTGEQIGSPSWLTLRFSDTVILSTDPYWLVTRATSGRAVWLAQPAETTIQVMTRQSEGGVWSPLSALEGLQAAFRFIAQSEGGLQTQPATAFYAHGQTLNGTSQEDGSKLYNLAAALNAALSTAPTNLTQVEIALGYTSHVPGLVTLRDLHIEYAT
jgi:hypothetical protein